MEIIYFMIGMSVFLALGFLFSFFWATDNSQFENLSLEPWRILWDEVDPHSGVQSDDTNED